MKYLEQYAEEDIIFFDIETARAVDTLDSGSPMHEAWLYKTRYGNELSRKTGEEVTPEAFFIEKAALYAPFAKIACIVAGRIVDGTRLSVKAYDGEGDETALLKQFSSDLGKMVKPGTILCGFNNIGFDQPFVTKRMIVNGITPPPLFDTAHLKPWEIKCLDLSMLWKGTSFYQDSLLAVSMALGLPSPKQGMDGSEVSNAYYRKEYKQINEYCIQDVLTTANVYRKFKNKPLLKR
jgi:hypothetical protein